MAQRTITTLDQAKKLVDFLTGLSVPYTITVREGKVRTLSQNALLHKWFGEIAKQGDLSASQAKGQCHHEYGLPIRLRDPQFAWLWNNSAAKLDYEKRCAVLASGQFQISSKMNTKELSEYMDSMHAEYNQRGIYLTIPEDQA
jgi:hypothetical protein